MRHLPDTPGGERAVVRTADGITVHCATILLLESARVWTANFPLWRKPMATKRKAAKKTKKIKVSDLRVSKAKGRGVKGGLKITETNS